MFVQMLNDFFPSFDICQISKLDSFVSDWRGHGGWSSGGQSRPGGSKGEDHTVTKARLIKAQETHKKLKFKLQNSHPKTNCLFVFVEITFNRFDENGPG